MEIEIHETTFGRLQDHARPLVDTPDTVINRALDALERLHATPMTMVEDPSRERRIDPLRLPDFKHTKVLDAVIDGQSIANPNWNRLLDHIVVLAVGRLSDFGQVQKTCPVNMVQGRKDDEGYDYLVEAGISIQGQSANSAGRALVTISQELGVPLEIGFMWRLKDGAKHPGERARLML